VLNSGVSVAEVAEVVDVSRSEKCSGGKRMDGGITPLGQVSLRFVLGN
jgi:hypothetical protein